MPLDTPSLKYLETKKKLDDAYARFDSCLRSANGLDGIGFAPGKIDEGRKALKATDDLWNELQQIAEVERNLPRDKHLGAVSYLEGEGHIVARKETDAISAVHDKISHLRRIGYRVRDLLHDDKVRHSLGFHVQFSKMDVKEQGAALFQILSANSRLISSLDRNPSMKEIVALVREFQRVIPVLPAKQITMLTTAPDVGGDVAMLALRKLDNGDIEEDAFFRGMEILAKKEGVSLLESDSPREVAEDLAEKLAKRAGIGSAWYQRGYGVESKVYQDDSGYLYKVTPIQVAQLDIPEIKDGSPLYPRLGSNLFANECGQIPILERLYAAASIEGQAKTDLVGLIDDGHVVFKQLDIGDKEPTADQVKAWAIKNGHEVLSPQDPDPLGEHDNDASLIPVVTEVDGDIHLLLDVNPRNSRVYKGQVIPFDTVSRPLLEREIAKNPEIKAAAERLRLRKGSPTIKQTTDNAPPQPSRAAALKKALANIEQQETKKKGARNVTGPAI